MDNVHFKGTLAISATTLILFAALAQEKPDEKVPSPTATAVPSPAPTSKVQPNSTQSPIPTPASVPTPAPPKVPAFHPLTPDQVELWLETVNTENANRAAYLEAIRVRTAVLEQIQRELNCSGCGMVKQASPTSQGRAVYMLVPANK